MAEDLSSSRLVEQPLRSGRSAEMLLAYDEESDLELVAPRSEEDVPPRRHLSPRLAVLALLGAAAVLAMGAVAAASSERRPLRGASSHTTRLFAWPHWLRPHWLRGFINPHMKPQPPALPVPTQPALLPPAGAQGSGPQLPFPPAPQPGLVPQQPGPPPQQPEYPPQGYPPQAPAGQEPAPAQGSPAGAAWGYVAPPAEAAGAGAGAYPTEAASAPGAARAPAQAPVEQPTGDMCATAEECLQIVDRYLDTCPRSFGLLQARGDGKAQGLADWINLGGGPCPSCGLPAACPEGPAKCRHDTYDSAVVAIYYVKRGRLEDAKAILDTFIKALYPTAGAQLRPLGRHTEYTGAASGRKITLLASSYNSVHEPTAGNYQDPFVTDGGVDSGNNAWAALAFAHYAAAAQAPCYATVARDILSVLVSAGTCADGLGGYLGHLQPYPGNYRSAEHNIDLFALAKVLGDAAVQESAHAFVHRMYGANRAFPTSYAMGTGSGRKCDPSINGGALPADATFWNLLADADAAEPRMSSALKFALQTPERKPNGMYTTEGLWVTDSDIILPEGGLRDQPVKVTGTRFTTIGNGVQWEVTASAVMAMAHYQQKYGTGAEFQLPEHLNQARDSLKILLKMYNGVPQSVLGGNYGAWQSHAAIGTDYPGGTDTGLGWPYLRYLGTVTTAWTGLAMLYQSGEGEPVNEDANPYAVPSQPVPAGGDCSCLPPAAR